MRIRQMALLGALAGTMLSGPAAARTPSGLEIGLELFDYGYRERHGGATIVRDDGRFIGLAIDYTQRLGGAWLLRGRLAGAVGSVDYRSTGSIGEDNDEEVRLDGVTQGIGRFELLVGRDFALSEATTLTPFIGLGSRVLNDESGGEESDNGLLGYDRQVSYAYVPVGVALRHSLGGRRALTFTAQYQHLVGGESESRFSDIDPEVPDVTVDLKGGSGFEIAAIADLPIGSDAVRVGPFLRRWSIGRSDSFVITNPDDPAEAIELFEPANRTLELGLRLSIAF